jgi:lysophospholipase L1-like esterase
VPYQFGFRSGLYDRLTNSGFAIQFVGNSPEPWDGKFGVPRNTPVPDLRQVDQDHCQGYGGMGTSFIAANIAAWVTVDQPDIVLLMAGINDIGSGSTGEPTAVKFSLSNIVQTIVRTAPNTRVIVAQITPYSTYTAAIVKYNNYIRDILVPALAAQGKHVTTVNQYTNLLVTGRTNINAALFANHINHPSASAYDGMAQTWFEGIQALDLPPPPSGAPKINLVTNGGFEIPAFTNTSHNIDPAGTGWMFTQGKTGAGSGIDKRDPYGGSSGSAAIEGRQQAFLQSSGNSSTTRVAQVVSGFTAGQYYQLSFFAKGIQGYSGANPFQVRMLDGEAVTPLFASKDIVPGTTAYALYTSEPFPASNPIMTLEFSDHGLATAQKVSWIDAVAIRPPPGATLSAHAESGQVRIQFTGYTNVSYSVVGSADLNLPLTNWTLLGTAVLVSSNLFHFVDAPAANEPQRFYRVRLP